MTGVDITRLVLLVNAVFLLLYDLFAVWYWGFPSTISVVLYDAVRVRPIIALIIGIVMGHIFFPLYDK